jgi:plastocyanin
LNFLCIVRLFGRKSNIALVLYGNLYPQVTVLINKEKVKKMKRKILLLVFILMVSKVYGKELQVSLTNFSFSPATVTINVGDNVKWTNNDAAAHTVDANNGAFSSGTLSNGASFTFKFNTPGTYDYYCAFHSGMVGKIIVLSNTTKVDITPIPESFMLYQNYPNPFNPVTKIPFYLSNGSNVRIVVYSIIGKEVGVIRNGFFSEGYHLVEFDGSKFSSGVYFYKITAGEFGELIASRRMVLAK